MGMVREVTVKKAATIRAHMCIVPSWLDMVSSGNRATMMKMTAMTSPNVRSARFSWGDFLSVT